MNGRAEGPVGYFPAFFNRRDIEHPACLPYAHVGTAAGAIERVRARETS